MDFLVEQSSAPRRAPEHTGGDNSAPDLDYLSDQQVVQGFRNTTEERTKAIMSTMAVSDTAGWLESLREELQGTPVSLWTLTASSSARAGRRNPEDDRNRLREPWLLNRANSRKGGSHGSATGGAASRRGTEPSGGELLDFQAELIGELADHRIDTRFAELEPG